MWTEERLATLIAAASPETRTLEFKARLPERSDRDRAEFLKDVSAMANASGGSILFGVAEAAGVASKLANLRLGDPDAEIRRLSQILEAGVEPRLSGVRFTPIKSPEGDVLILDVPQSFDSPHRYLFNGHSKFVARMGSHISELSYEQLKAAFDQSSTRVERLREHWKQDFSLARMWKPIIPGPVCVIRLSPLLSADGRQVVDPKAAHGHWSNLIMSDWGGGSSSFNYEGLAIYHGRGQDALGGYVQVHRTGAITAYRTARITIDDRKIIPSTTVGDFMIEATIKMIEFARLCGIAGSAVVNIGLRRLLGYEFGARDRYGFDESKLSEIDEILMPEFWIGDLEDQDLSADALLQPGFDLLWQSFGWAECPKFGADGRWNPNLR